MEEPSSSIIALIINGFIMFCIIASTVTFCIETIPAEEAKQTLWWHWEIFYVVVFISEILLRLWSRRVGLCEFYKRPLNIVDVLAVVPFFLEITVLYTGGYLDLRFLRSIRLLRLFKFGRHSTQLQLIMGGIHRSLWPLMLVFFMLTLALVMFGTAMFLVERGTWDPIHGCYIRTDGRCSPFQSIPLTFWWAIATLTTVGYGDVYPITLAGRCVAGLAMIVGIICVALPTTVLGVQFSEAYMDLKAQMEMDNLRAAVDSQSAAMSTVAVVNNSDGGGGEDDDDTPSAAPAKRHATAASRAAAAASRLVTTLEVLNAIKQDLLSVLPSIRSDMLILANPESAAMDILNAELQAEPVGAAELAARSLFATSGSLDSVVERSIAILGANSANSVQAYIDFVFATTEEYFTMGSNQ